MYRYGQVEAALAILIGVEPDSMGAFRGRIVHLRRLGITPSAPKKGAPIEYTFEQVAIIAYCLQLAEFGLDPISTKIFLEVTWGKVISSLQQVEKEDMFLCFFPNAMSRVFVGNLGKKALVASIVLPQSEATYAEVIRRFTPKRIDLADPDWKSFAARLGMMNLSHIRRSLVAALESVAA